jgi:hypothetical protein
MSTVSEPRGAPPTGPGATVAVAVGVATTVAVPVGVATTVVVPVGVATAVAVAVGVALALAVGVGVNLIGVGENGVRVTVGVGFFAVHFGHGSHPGDITAANAKLAISVRTA